MSRLYLYLTSRSKDGIKLVTVMKSESQVTSRITDLSRLQLPPVWEREVERVINDNRMLYEPWIETAPDYATLRSRLIKRGFTNIPQGVTPLLNLASYDRGPKANTSSCKTIKTMIRRSFH